MFNSVSNLTTQIGVAFAAFLISATCILAAVGPVHTIA